MTYVDLHSHTIYSDGDLQPKELLKRMKKIGLEAIAITDHDNMDGYFEGKEEAVNLGITLIPGVEITNPVYHILGIGIDEKSERFREFVKTSRDIQEEVCKIRIDKLKELGIPITIEKVRKHYPFSRLGKLNILGTMMNDEECKKHLNEYTPNMTKNQLFRHYLGNQGKIPWVRKGVVEDDITIKEIHAAGGIAILAHPFKEIKEMKELDTLVEKGLDGIEIQPNYGKRNVPFVEYAKAMKLLTTYGSDYHGDWKEERQLLGRRENQMNLGSLPARK